MRDPHRRSGLGVAAATYAGSAAFTWYRYGTPRPGTPEEADPLLDRFMAAYEVVERHNVRVRAPAKITLTAAYEQNLLASPVIRAIFKARELALGSTPDERARPQALLPQMLALGWGILAEVPGQEIVMGAVTKPWDPNPRFRAIGPEHFAAFDEPDYVKIVWSLRADAIGPHESIFRTETRAVATDDLARLTFRRYWALVSPGVALIRRSSLGPLKADAERRARMSPAVGGDRAAVSRTDPAIARAPSQGGRDHEPERRADGRATEQCRRRGHESRRTEPAAQPGDHSEQGEGADAGKPWPVGHRASVLAHSRSKPPRSPPSIGDDKRAIPVFRPVQFPPGRRSNTYLSRPRSHTSPLRSSWRLSIDSSWTCA